MRLYLVQHGESVPATEDPERPLTDHGRADIRLLGACLARFNIRVSRIVHSGKLRACATATLLEEALGGDIAVEVQEKGLLPKDSPVYFAETLATWPDDGLVVGHQPFMSRLVSRLVLGAEQPTIVDFTPGTLVCLACRPVTGAWFIAWMITPDLLRRGGS